MATPIWKDYYVTINVTTAEDYYVFLGSDNTGTLIYVGRAYCKPNESSIKVKINDICADYLYQHLPDIDGDFSKEDSHITQTFAIYAGGGQYISPVDTITFAYDYSYRDTTPVNIHRPITGRIEQDMYIPFCVADGGGSGYIRYYDSESTVTSESASVPFTAFVRAYPTATRNDRSVVTFTRSTTTVVSYAYDLLPKCHRWALYYVNEFGAWDVLVIEGRVKMSDEYDRLTYNRVYDNSIQTTAGQQVIHNSIERSWELHTGWLTTEQASRMHHLLGSNNVYLFDYEGAEPIKHPVLITNKNYEEKDVRYDGMISYRIDVKLARDMTRR